MSYKKHYPSFTALSKCNKGHGETVSVAYFILLQLLPFFISGYTLYPGYNPMAAYYQASQLYQTGPIPPPPDLQPVIDKTAEYVAKNGDQFETTVIHKHLSDPRFAFLHPWNQYNHYYKTKVSEFKEVVRAARENAPANMQKLNTSGAVSFKMPSKQQPATIVPARINLGHYGDDDDDEDEEEKVEPDIDEERVEPISKKVKMSESEIVMDKTVKVYNSFESSFPQSFSTAQLFILTCFPSSSGISLNCQKLINMKLTLVAIFIMN